MIDCITVDLKLFEGDIKKLFQKQPFGRFLSDRKIKQSAAVEFEWNNLLNYSNQGVVVLAVNERSSVIGLIGFHFSKWDTNVFEKRLAYLKYFIVEENKTETERSVGANLLERLHDWVRTNNIQVVISKLDTQFFSPIFLLQQNGYIFYETITYQSLDLTDVKDSIKSVVKYRHACEADAEKLREIASKNTFGKSHFYLDFKFPVRKVDYMYACWIDSALKSNKQIVIVEENGQIAGAFIYDLADFPNALNKKIAIWDSAFVDMKFRGKGTGYKLFKAALNSCINEGVEVIDSVLVEKNIISQILHNKLGFQLVFSQYTFHKWF